MQLGKRDVYLQVILAVVGAVVVSVMGLAGSVRDFVERGVYLPLIVVVLILAVVGRDLFREFRPKRTPNRLRTEVFSGLSRPDDSQTWSHPHRLTQLREAVAAHVGGPIVVTGPSGAGKSVLLDKLRKELGDANVRWIDDYGDEFIDALERDAKAGALADVVVVFDQIEAMLGRGGGRSIARRAERTVGAIRRLNELGVRIIISVRSERFVDLRRLEVPLPSPENSLFIDAISPDRDGNGQKEEWKVFINRLERVVEDEALEALITMLEAADDPLTPLEMQAVGAIHEIRVKFPEESAPDTVRPEAAARWLLDREIRAQEAPRTAMEVLYVLAQFRLVRIETDKLALEQLIDEPLAEIVRCLDSLEEAGIIRRSVTGKVLLAHDYLQPVVENLSAEWMSPEERDTLRDIASRYVRDRQSVLEVLEQTTPDRTLFPQIIAALTVLISLSGLVAALPWDQVQRSLMDTTILEPMRGTGITDGLYLPIFFAHVYWCWYIFLHAHRIYRFTDRTPRNRVTTKVLLIVLMFAMTLGVFLPLLWISAVAIGGLMAAAKSYEISLSSPQGAVRDWFQSLAVKTFINSTITLFGGALWAVVLVRQAIPPSAAQRGQYIIAFLLFMVAHWLRKDHVSSRFARLKRLLVRRAAIPA
jgi:hypothetical protein